MAKRTTHRSTAGKKLYAVKDKKTGQVKEIQTHQHTSKSSEEAMDRAVKKYGKALDRLSKR